MSSVATERSAVMPVRCNDDSCGMTSAYRFYKDGSYRKILDACCHAKRMPTLPKIAAEFNPSTPGK